MYRYYCHICADRLYSNLLYAQGDTTLAGPGTDTLAQPRSLDSAKNCLPVTTAAAGDIPLKIYPNPSSQQDIILTFSNALTGKVSVTLMTSAGVVLQTLDAGLSGNETTDPSMRPGSQLMAAEVCLTPSANSGSDWPAPP